MRTVIPQTITNAQEADAFLRSLEANGEGFHYDDPPSEIIKGLSGEPLFTPEEAAQVQRAINQIRQVCNLWELPVIYEILEEASREYKGLGFKD